ncbi:MAG: PAS domain S-box protein [archaeon]|nr:PAS domain S-box protein [archaeon]
MPTKKKSNKKSYSKKKTTKKKKASKKTVVKKKTKKSKIKKEEILNQDLSEESIVDIDHLKPELKIEPILEPIKPLNKEEKVEISQKPKIEEKKLFFNQIIKMIHSLSEDSDVIPKILDEGSKILSANAAVLVIWENKMGFYNTMYGFENEIELKSKLISPTDGLSGRIFQEKKTISLKNYSKSINAYTPFKPLRFSFAIGTPIILRDDIVANINFYYGKNPEFDLEHMNKFVEELAEQMSIVILNSRIYQELQEQSEKLKRTVNYLNLILNNSPNIIIDVDNSSKVNFWNKTATEILGYNPHEIANLKLPLSEGKNKERFLDIFIQTRRGDSIEDVDIEYVAKNKVKKLINTKIIPIMEKDKEEPSSILFFGTDISKKQLLEKKIQKAEKEIHIQKKELEKQQQMLAEQLITLESAEKMALIGKMYGNLAHQINNPLMIMINLIQLIIDGKEEGIISMNDEMYTFLMELPKEINKIKDIIKILRVYSEIALQTKKRETYALNCLNDAIKDIKSKVLGSPRVKINLTSNVSPKNPKIMGRYQQIMLSFYNILENAVISTKTKEMNIVSGKSKGSDKWDKSININVENLQINKIPYIRIKIGDSGIGIDENEIRNVTKPFYTNWPLADIEEESEEIIIDTNTGEPIENIRTGHKTIIKNKEFFCGMGLTITNAIIKAHSGHIYAKSKLLKGTTFIIDLPII